MEDIRVKACKICQSDKIDYKIEVLTSFEVGDDKIKSWCFCRNCGHRGLSAFGRMSVDDTTKIQRCFVKSTLTI